MSKQLRSDVSRARMFASEFTCFEVDGALLFCKFCETAVDYTIRSRVTQRSNTVKHQTASHRQKPNQTFLQAANTSKTDKFTANLCQALLASNIPVYRLNSQPFREFLHKYTQRQIPEESTLRQIYIAAFYQ